MKEDQELVRLAAIKTLQKRSSRPSKNARGNRSSTYFPAPDRANSTVGSSIFSGRPPSSLFSKDTSSRGDSLAASDISGDGVDTISDCDTDTFSVTNVSSRTKVTFNSFCHCVGSEASLVAAGLSNSSLLLMVEYSEQRLKRVSSSRRWLVSWPAVFNNAIEDMATSPDLHYVIMICSNQTLNILKVEDVENESISTTSASKPDRANLNPSLAQLTRSARGTLSGYSSIASIEDVFVEPTLLTVLRDHKRTSSRVPKASTSATTPAKCLWWQSENESHFAIVATGAGQIHFVDLASVEYWTLQLPSNSPALSLQIIKFNGENYEARYLLAICADCTVYTILLETGIQPAINEERSRSISLSVDVSSPKERQIVDEKEPVVSRDIKPFPSYWQLTQRTSGESKASPLRIETFPNTQSVHFISASYNSDVQQDVQELRFAAITKGGLSINFLRVPAETILSTIGTKKRLSITSTIFGTVKLPVEVRNSRSKLWFSMSLSEIRALFELQEFIILICITIQNPPEPPTIQILTSFRFSKAETISAVEMNLFKGCIYVCTNSCLYELRLDHYHHSRKSLGKILTSKLSKGIHALKMREAEGARHALSKSKRFYESGKYVQAIELLAKTLGIYSEESKSIAQSNTRMSINSRSKSLYNISFQMEKVSLADTLLKWVVDYSEQKDNKKTFIFLEDFLKSDAPYDPKLASRLLIDRQLVSEAIIMAVHRKDEVALQVVLEAVFSTVELRLTQVDIETISVSGFGLVLISTCPIDYIASLDLSLQLQILTCNRNMLTGEGSNDVHRKIACTQLCAIIPKLSPIQNFKTVRLLSSWLPISELNESERKILDIIVISLLHCICHSRDSIPGCDDLYELLCFDSIMGNQLMSCGSDSSAYETIVKLLRDFDAIDLEEEDKNSIIDVSTKSQELLLDIYHKFGRMLDSTVILQKSFDLGNWALSALILDSSESFTAASHMRLRGTLKFVHPNADNTKIQNILLGIEPKWSKIDCKLDDDKLSTHISYILRRFLCSKGVFDGNLQVNEHPLPQIFCLWRYLSLPSKVLQNALLELLEDENFGIQLGKYLSSLFFPKLAYYRNTSCGFSEQQMQCVHDISFDSDLLFILLKKLMPFGGTMKGQLGNDQFEQLCVIESYLKSSKSNHENFVKHGRNDFVNFSCGHFFTKKRMADVILPLNELELQSSSKVNDLAIDAWKEFYESLQDGMMTQYECPQCSATSLKNFLSIALDE